MVIHEIETRKSDFGDVLYIKLHEDGYPPLSWDQVSSAFSEAYPGRWAVQCFPPEDQIVNGKAVYHLFVLEKEPLGLNIR